MESKKFIRFLNRPLRNNRGQGVVEYILLLVVLSGLASLILKSDSFKQFLGSDSSFFGAVAQRLEFSYRYGHNGEDDSFGSGYGGGGHPLYQNADGKTRFFGPEEKYEQ